MTAVLLAGVGMVTPVGIGVEMVNTSVQAGINRYAQTDIIGHDDDPVRMALVPQSALAETVDNQRLKGAPSTWQKRMLCLATLALTDLAERTPCLPLQPVPLFLAGPEPYISLPNIDCGFIEDLAEQSGVNIDISNCRVTNTGRAGGIQSIDTAFKYFASTGAHYALVGGVDSFYDRHVMNYLDETSRLLKNDSLDGFVPGEGAGFLLLVSPDAPEEIRQQATVCLYSPGISHEAGHLLGKKKSRAESLAAAFAQANAATPEPVRYLYSSENGERYYAKELSVALIRNQQAMSPQYDIYRPAESFGDLGAAFGPVAVGLASVNSASDKTATLVYCSSDSSPRAALCMTSLVNMENSNTSSSSHQNDTVTDNTRKVYDRA